MKRSEKAILMNMCMIYDDNGNVLVEDRIDSSWPGVAFPGGHVEPKEAFSDAMIREVFEETGLTVSNLQMCGVHHWTEDDDIHYITLLYKTNKFSGKIKSSDEGEVYWTSLDSLQNLNLAMGMKQMLKVFLEDNFTEHFYYKENGEWIEVLK